MAYAMATRNSGCCTLLLPRNLQGRGPKVLKMPTRAKVNHLSLIIESRQQPATPTVSSEL